MTQDEKIERLLRLLEWVVEPSTLTDAQAYANAERFPLAQNPAWNDIVPNLTSAQAWSPPKHG